MKHDRPDHKTKRNSFDSGISAFKKKKTKKKRRKEREKERRRLETIRSSGFEEVEISAKDFAHLRQPEASSSYNCKLSPSSSSKPKLGSTSISNPLKRPKLVTNGSVQTLNSFKATTQSFTGPHRPVHQHQHKQQYPKPKMATARELEPEAATKLKQWFVSEEDSAADDMTSAIKQQNDKEEPEEDADGHQPGYCIECEVRLTKCRTSCVSVT